MKYFVGAVALLAMMASVTCNAQGVELARKDRKPKEERHLPYDDCLCCVHMRKNGTYTVDSHGSV